MKPDEIRSTVNIVNEGKSEVIPLSTVEITQDEYEILIEKSTELELLKKALRETEVYSAELALIKATFGIAKKGE